ncbi:LOW QUALITY PROTEIN: neurturin-like [Tachyglossus aculeatus]|uniref:LOW QUALITY PROTEIN: neurturin-like n=1 Tax=Tachyglossus aculeatus TaxID=9261 RepID=UPI0018F702AF|nr:LOW QUALITY PROTEIN: neurturin-like [Tachyglossus aculeatus]
MKLWKLTAVFSMICSSMLSVWVCRDTFRTGRQLSSARPPANRGGIRRSPRALDHWRPLISQYRALFESYTEGEIRELVATLVERYSPTMNSGRHELPLPLGRAGARRKRARARHKPCGLRELEVSVNELGLGYVSNETVLFRYCSGTCETAVRVYDLGLRRLREQRRVRKEKVRAQPCCRPLAYNGGVSFLDSKNRYHTVSELSAKECGCM